MAPCMARDRHAKGVAIPCPRWIPNFFRIIRLEAGVKRVEDLENCSIFRTSIEEPGLTPLKNPGSNGKRVNENVAPIVMVRASTPWHARFV